jgi:hypothetical protein
MEHSTDYRNGRLVRDPFGGYRRTAPVKGGRSPSFSDAVGALDGFRETSTIPGGGLGSALLPKPRRCQLWSPTGNWLRLLLRYSSSWCPRSRRVWARGCRIRDRCGRSPGAAGSGARRAAIAAPRSLKRERRGPRAGPAESGARHALFVPRGKACSATVLPRIPPTLLRRSLRH